METVHERQQSRDGTDTAAHMQDISVPRRASGSTNIGGTEPGATKSTEKTLAGTFQSLFSNMGTLPKRNGKDKPSVSAQSSLTSTNSGIQSYPAPHHGGQKFQTTRTVNGSKKGTLSTGGASAQISSSGLNNYGPDGVSLSDDTSSSSINSLTPSPGAPMVRPHAYNILLDKHHIPSNTYSTNREMKGSKIGGGQRGLSTMSLDETDSSDDSTYSSQV